MSLSIRCPRALAFADILLFASTAALPESALAAPNTIAATNGKNDMS